jgi:thymidylate synthase
MRILGSNDIRNEFCRLLATGGFTAVNREAAMVKLVGSRTLEIIGAAFLTDDDALFGFVDWDYVAREEAWYDSQSRNVNDLTGNIPAVWKSIASTDGTINSNYGWVMYSPENHSQYEHVLAELRLNPESRRAQAIYNRPTMWAEYNLDGRSDFMCTNAVGYLIRGGALHAVVQMRSNDAVLGFKNDLAWQRTVLTRLAKDLNVSVGNVHWQVSSLHVYERHFFLVDHYWRTGHHAITKAQYRELYPNSPYLLKE